MDVNYRLLNINVHDVSTVILCIAIAFTFFSTSPQGSTQKSPLTKVFWYCWACWSGGRHWGLWGISSLLALDVSRPSEVGWTELVCCCLSYSAEDVATMSGSWCFVWAFGPEFRFQIFWDMFSSVDLGSTLFIAKDIVPLLSSNFCFLNWRLVTYSLNYLLVNVSQGGFDGSLTLSVGFSLICWWN